MERCALCLEHRKLRKSHLMPKSLYKVVRGEKGVVYAVGESGSRYTDRQITTSLLCGACEQMFSQKGEQVVCSECYRGEGNFVLREKLKKVLEESTGWIVPQTVSKDINLSYESYLYFGASIIWRASTGKWPSYGKRVRGGLGVYEEKIRRYLVGETNFPRKVYLLVNVNSDEEDREPNFNLIMDFPRYGKMEGYYFHRFNVPGICFVFIIGGVPRYFEAIFKELGTSILFQEMSFKEKGVFRDFTKDMLKPKGRLREEIEGLISDAFFES